MKKFLIENRYFQWKRCLKKLTLLAKNQVITLGENILWNKKNYIASDSINNSLALNSLYKNIKYRVLIKRTKKY